MEGVECRIILEYDAEHPDRFFCPKHNSKAYSDINRKDTWVYHQCFVCERIEGEFYLEYLPQDNALSCPNCGVKMAIDIAGPEKRGTMEKKYVEAYNDREGLSDIKSSERYLYLIGRAESLAYIKWESRERFVT